MLKLIICIGFLGAVLVDTIQTVAENDCSKPFNEPPCLSSGGICIAAGDCPDGRLAKVSGLCPLQQRQGIECCYGISKSEKRCRYNGGECVPRTRNCPDILTFKDAIDCEADKKCCILV